MGQQTITIERDRLDSAISLVADVVRSTMGPYPKNVTITRELLPDGKVISGRSINDGVQIVRSLHSDDPMINLAYERIRRACEATLNETGDGTSSTVVLFEAFYKWLSQTSERYVSEKFAHDIQLGCDMLKLQAMPIGANEESRTILRHVANIAMHNHPWAHGIADLLFDLGLDGSFTVELSKDGQFSTERLEGFRWGAGVATQEFFNIRGRFECNKAYVAVVSGEIADLDDIRGVIKAYTTHYVQNQGAVDPLVIVCQRITGNAMAALVRAQIQGFPHRAPMFVIGTPVVEDARAQMEDLAAVLGTVVFDKVQGRGASDLNIELKDLGLASRIVATDKFATVVPNAEGAGAARVAVLQDLLSSATQEQEQRLRGRISNIQGSFGVIRINVTTESEYNHLREVVEDGYRAVQSALQHGVLPGGGKALYELTGAIGFVPAFAVADALGHKVPGDTYWETTDLRTGDVVDAIEAGILDNAGSVIAALRNAAKEAALLHNTKYFILNGN